MSLNHNHFWELWNIVYNTVLLTFAAVKPECEARTTQICMQTVDFQTFFSPQKQFCICFNASAASSIDWKPVLAVRAGPVRNMEEEMVPIVNMPEPWQKPAAWRVSGWMTPYVHCVPHRDLHWLFNSSVKKSRCGCTDLTSGQAAFILHAEGSVSVKANVKLGL